MLRMPNLMMPNQCDGATSIAGAAVRSPLTKKKLQETQDHKPTSMEKLSMRYGINPVSSSESRIRHVPRLPLPGPTSLFELVSDGVIVLTSTLSIWVAPDEWFRTFT
jgi:hypothetical protein